MVKAGTLYETIIAVTIIAICLSVSAVIISSILKNDEGSLSYLKAQQLIYDAANYKNELLQKNSNIKHEGLIISKENIQLNDENIIFNKYSIKKNNKVLKVYYFYEK